MKTGRILILSALCLAVFGRGIPGCGAEDSFTGPDKGKHIVVSGILTVSASAFYERNTSWTESQLITAAVLSTLTIGLVKEWYDQSQGRPFSWKDMAANAVGAGIGVAVRVSF